MRRGAIGWTPLVARPASILGALPSYACSCMRAPILTSHSPCASSLVSGSWEVEFELVFVIRCGR